MSRAVIVFLSFLIVFSCSQSKEENPEYWDGKWNATWETDPASFEGIDGISDFTMNGYFVFDGNQVNIQAFGFEGCVFSKDTLDHNLSWKISNDSLILINDEDTPGMVYSIKESGDSKISLQLMDDIFLTLTK